MLGKRSPKVVQVDYPLWFKKDLARLGKRGAPGFTIPDSWRKSKPQARNSMSSLRNKIYSEDREKRNLQSNTVAWYPRRDSSWFRFHDGDNGSLGSVVYKRGENPHIKDFNSVPFMGEMISCYLSSQAHQTSFRQESRGDGRLCSEGDRRRG